MIRKILITLMLAGMFSAHAQVEVFKGFILDTLTTAQLNALPSKVKIKGAHFYNKDISSLVGWNGSSWVAIGSGTIADGSITEVKLNTSVNASLDLADSAIQPGDYPNLDTDFTNDVDTTSDQDIGGVKNFTERINQSGLNGSVYVGDSVGIAVTTGARNVGLGDNALSAMTTGTGNVAIGSRALDSLTSGLFNVAIGENALASNTTTGVNIAIGADAMELAVGAGQNVAVGNNSLKNTQADNNVAIGHSSMTANTTGEFNASVGGNTLISNTTGVRNAILGHTAFNDNTSGSNNVAIGYNAGNGDSASGSNNNATASSSVYIGSNARPQTVNGTNEIVIGASSVGNGSNTATIGNSNTTGTYLNGTIHGDSAPIKNIADPVDDQDAATKAWVLNNSTSSFALPESNLSVGSQTTDASFENKLNVTALAGTYTIVLASDSSYDHPDGTILYFKNKADASLTFNPDTGVTGFTSFSILQNQSASFIKSGADEWELFESSTSGISGIAPDRTNAGPITTFVEQSLADYIADGPPPEGVKVLIKDPLGFEEVSAGSSTIDWVDSDGRLIAKDLYLDNTTARVVNFTLQDQNIGYTVEIYLNQATEPTFTGSPTLVGGLDWTDDSLANTDVTILVWRTGKGVRKAYRLGH